MTCAWMDTSSAETGSSQTMKSGLTAGDADALALAAGKFVGVAGGMLGVEADIAHELENALLPFLPAGVELMHVQRLADDVGDGHAGVEGGIGILEDHGGLVAEGLDVGLGLDLPALVEDFAAGGLVQVQDGAADGRLAAAGLADQTQRLAGLDGKAHVVDGLERLRPEHAHVDVKILFEIAYFDDRLCSFVFHASAPSFRSASLSSASSMLPSSRPFLMFIQHEAR